MKEKLMKGLKLGCVPGGILTIMLVISPARAAAPVEVTNTQALAFGAMVAGPLGGTVTVSPAGARSCSADITCLPQSSAQPARYTVTGDPSTTFLISLPVTATLSDGAGSFMTVDTFEDSLGGSGFFNALGQASFTIGATLHLGADQPAAVYSGSFDVTVVYQ